MEEHKDNPNATLKAEPSEEQKKYQAEVEAKRAEFRKLLDTPISKEEAEKQIAENNVNRCRIKALMEQIDLRMQGLAGDVGKLRAQLVDLDGEDAIIRRRMLNGTK